MKTIALFLLSVIASFADPAGFKGVPFGTGCASFFQTYKPGGSWAEKKLPAEIFYSDADQALIAIPPQMSGIMMGKVWTEWLKDSVAGVESDTKFFFAIQTADDAAKLKKGIDRWTADKALFQKVEARFQSRFSEQVLAALVEKYGEPTRTEEKPVMHRGTGVKGNVNVKVWEIPGAIVEFAKIAPPKSDPLLVITSTTVKSLAAKAGASDL